MARARGQRRAADGGAMPLMEHLRELRSRIAKALIAIFIGALIGWFFYEPIFDFIIARLRGGGSPTLPTVGLTVVLTLQS